MNIGGNPLGLGLTSYLIVLVWPLLQGHGFLIFCDMKEIFDGKCLFEIM